MIYKPEDVKVTWGDVEIEGFAPGSCIIKSGESNAPIEIKLDMTVTVGLEDCLKTTP